MDLGWRKRFERLVDAFVNSVGYLVALICSIEISALPISLLFAYLPIHVTNWVGQSLWGVSYLITVYWMSRLSRIRYGVFIIFVLAMVSFVIGESQIAQFDFGESRFGCYRLSEPKRAISALSKTRDAVSSRNIRRAA